MQGQEDSFAGRYDPLVDIPAAWRLVESAPVGVLSTIRPDGTPRSVPFVFAVTSDHKLVTAVDHKPKSTRALARLRDIDRDSRVTVLVQHYADDWSRLWWVRIDGTAIVSDSPDHGHRELLMSKYDQYRDRPPSGPWIVIEADRVAGWSP